MTYHDRIRNLDHIRAALREINREHSPEEVEQAARALGAERYLPDPQEELPLRSAA